MGGNTLFYALAIQAATLSRTDHSDMIHIKAECMCYGVLVMPSQFYWMIKPQPVPLSEPGPALEILPPGPMSLEMEVPQRGIATEETVAGFPD